MGKLRGLINGQDVSFDTHQAGDKQQINWKNVHLEKRIHNRGGKARFPLLGGEKPSNSGMNDNDFSRVITEVKRILKKDRKLVRELAETIVTQLEKFSSHTATSETAKEAAKRFAEYFDLDSEFLRIVEEYTENRLQSFTSIHFNPVEQTLHEIHQSGKEIRIQKPRRNNSLKRIYPKK